MNWDNYPTIDTLTDEELKQLCNLKFLRDLEETHNWRSGRVEFICARFEDQDFIKHSVSTVLDVRSITTPYHNSKVPEDKLMETIKYLSLVALEKRVIEKIAKEGKCPACGYHFINKQDIYPHLITHTQDQGYS